MKNFVVYYQDSYDAIKYGQCGGEFVRSGRCWQASLSVSCGSLFAFDDFSSCNWAKFEGFVDH